MRIVYHGYFFTSTNYCAHWGKFLSFALFGLSAFGCLLCLETVSAVLCVVLSKIKAATRILPREVRIYPERRKAILRRFNRLWRAKNNDGM